MNDKINNLQKQIDDEKRRISSCKHNFSESYYNPETVNEPYGSRMIVNGSDVWYEYEGYREVKKDRWSRKCTLCDFVQHTYNQKPIIKGYEPNF